MVHSTLAPHLLRCGPTFRVLLGCVLTALIASALAPTPLPIKAGVVLTSDFCATELKRGSSLSGREKFEVGKGTCPELFKALTPKFSSLERLERMPEQPNADLILVPKFADLGTTLGGLRKKREFIILIEWTAVNRAGKTVWLQTVQGTAQESPGGLFHGRINARRMLKNAITDTVAKSVNEILSAPELRELAK